MKNTVYSIILLIFLLLFIANCGIKERNNKNISENILYNQEININNELYETINFIENINHLFNKEIIINDNWAGQSFTLIQENDVYYINRKIFGSGVPYIGTIVYNVNFNSEYKITFSEIYKISENLRDTYLKNEIFEIIINEKVEIYLNGIKLDVNRII
ncbi:MAG: hypothetical protein FWD28_09380 [Treponema sp.]|nr:hypothetical protein [Treponema sp.]